MRNVIWWIMSHLRAILAWTVIVVAIIVAIRIMYNSSSQSSNVMSTSNLTARNFGYAQGNEVLAYNGLAFYSTNTQTGKRTVLFSGVKLPSVKSMYWAGSHGAAMVFNDNFYGTPVNGFLERAGMSVDNTTRDYTWYLDFKTGSLTVISTQPIAGPTLYDDTGKVFYYTTRTAGSSDGDKLRIYSYALEKPTSVVLLDDPNVTDIRDIAKCSTSKYVCIIAHLSSSNTLWQVYAINQPGVIGEIGELLNGGADGEVYPTGHKDHYIVSTIADNGASLPSTLYDVSKKQKKDYKLGFTFDEQSRIYFASDTDFYVIDGRTNGEFRAGRVHSNDVTSRKDRKLKLNDVDYSAKPITDVQSADGNSVSLISNSDKRQYLFGPKPLTFMSQVDKKEDAQLAASACGKKNKATNRYDADTRTFQIRVIALYGFAKSIQDFSSCMAKDHPDAIHGYYYSFVGINPDGSVAAK